jgi:hypothetical protein
MFAVVLLSVVLTGIVLAMMVPGFFLYRALVDRLRVRHASIWDELGRPALVFYGSVRGQRRFHDFVRRRRYEALDDAHLVRVARIYRGYVRTYSVLLVAAIFTLALAGLGIGVI